MIDESIGGTAGRIGDLGGVVDDQTVSLVFPATVREVIASDDEGDAPLAVDSAVDLQVIDLTIFQPHRKGPCSDTAGGGRLRRRPAMTDTLHDPQ